MQRHFDAFEVAWCYAVDDNGEIMSPTDFNPHDAVGALERGGVDDVDPSNAVVWTVYGHHPEGGVEAFSDFWLGPKLSFDRGRELAIDLANALSNTRQGVEVYVG